MKTKIRILLLVIFILVGPLTASQAQDKYDYAVITLNPYARIIGISINGTEFKEVKSQKDDLKDPKFDQPLMNPNLALRELKKMTDEGWELFDTGTPGMGEAFFHVFYLRKKTG